MMHHWTRAQDMSAALDCVLATQAEFVGPDRIMASGFSYGGWKALSLAAQTGNHAGNHTGNYAGYVAPYKADAETSTHCQDISHAGLR